MYINEIRENDLVMLKARDLDGSEVVYIIGRALKDFDVKKLEKEFKCTELYKKHKDSWNVNSAFVNWLVKEKGLIDVLSYKVIDMDEIGDIYLSVVEGKRLDDWKVIDCDDEDADFT